MRAIWGAWFLTISRAPQWSDDLLAFLLESLNDWRAQSSILRMRCLPFNLHKVLLLSIRVICLIHTHCRRNKSRKTTLFDQHLLDRGVNIICYRFTWRTKTNTQYRHDAVIRAHSHTQVTIDKLFFMIGLPNKNNNSRSIYRRFIIPCI